MPFVFLSQHVGVVPRNDVKSAITLFYCQNMKSALAMY